MYSVKSDPQEPNWIRVLKAFQSAGYDHAWEEFLCEVSNNDLPDLIDKVARTQDFNEYVGVYIQIDITRDVMPLVDI